MAAPVCALLSGVAVGRPVRAQGPAAVLDVCARAAVAPAGPPPAAVFDYNRAAPLDVRDSLVHEVLGVGVHAVSFASPNGVRATGLLYVPTARAPGRPDARGRYAGVILVHGAPGRNADMAPDAFTLARAGAVALAVDAPFARRDPERPLAFTPQDSVDMVQHVVDLRRAVDVLLARPDVDSARVGALGASYGGAVGALLAGVERRIAAHVLVVSDAGPAAHLTDPAGRRAPPPIDGIPAAQWCRWYDAMEPLAGTRFLARRSDAPAADARTAPARFLFQWGRQDRLVPRHVADRLWRAAPEPKEARWYDGGHDLTPAACAERHRWLGAAFKLAPPPAFEGAAADYLGAYRGPGEPGAPPLDVQVMPGRDGGLAMVGPLAPTGAPAPLWYVGPGPVAGEEVFRIGATLLTFTRTGRGAPTLRVDVPLEAPRVRLVLARVAPAAAARQ